MSQIPDIIELTDSSDDDVSTYDTHSTTLNIPARRHSRFAAKLESLQQPFVPPPRSDQVVIILDSDEEFEEQRNKMARIGSKESLKASMPNKDILKRETEAVDSKGRKPNGNGTSAPSLPMADLNKSSPTETLPARRPMKRQRATKDSVENRTPSPLSTTSSASGSSGVITRRVLPARQTRTKVVTYNDLINANADSAPDNPFSNYYQHTSGADRNGAVSKRAKVFKSAAADQTPSGSRPPKDYKVSFPLQTGFTYDISMQRHFSLVRREFHPENPWRTYKVFNIFEYHGLVHDCERILGRRATREEILLAHNIYHYRKMRSTVWLKTRKDYINTQNEYESIYLNCNTYDSALMAAGSLIEVTKAVVQRKVKNAFAIIRPPGHHATFDIAKGFCIFNNVAVASRNLIKYHGVKRVLIVDWDIHFGNGTQNIFTEDPNVLYMSLHRYEDSFFYPQDVRGAAEYTGHGEGEGTTVNIPWPCAGMTDADYIYAFENVVIPIATEFDPEIVIVSAGFDAAVGDPIGECFLTPAAFGQMTNMLKNIADGKLVLALEGGYNLCSIALSAYECMQVLMGAKPDPIDPNLVPQKGCLEAIEGVKKVQKKYWRCLQDDQ